MPTTGEHGPYLGNPFPLLGAGLRQAFIAADDFA
tara:strand:- start:44 stop:145 length:102 start_codon:yes stop_codon:yes gene_type:complete